VISPIPALSYCPPQDQSEPAEGKQCSSFTFLFQTAKNSTDVIVRMNFMTNRMNFMTKKVDEGTNQINNKGKDEAMRKSQQEISFSAFLIHKIETFAIKNLKEFHLFSFRSLPTSSQSKYEVHLRQFFLLGSSARLLFV